MRRQEADSLHVDEPDQGLLDLIEEITDRLQAGDPIPWDQYLEEHSQYADQLRTLAPSLQAMEALGQPDDSSAMTGSSNDRAPRELGDYPVIREIGRGGMGVVYEAEQLSLSRRVARKVLPFAAALDKRHLQRFKVSARQHHFFLGGRRFSSGGAAGLFAVGLVAALWGAVLADEFGM